MNHPVLRQVSWMNEKKAHFPHAFVKADRVESTRSPARPRNAPSAPLPGFHKCSARRQFYRRELVIPAGFQYLVCLVAREIDRCLGCRQKNLRDDCIHSGVELVLT